MLDVEVFIVATNVVIVVVFVDVVTGVVVVVAVGVFTVGTLNNSPK